MYTTLARGATSSLYIPRESGNVRCAPLQARSEVQAATATVMPSATNPSMETYPEVIWPEPQWITSSGPTTASRKQP
eukprot:4035597-Pyramimonas_sp.AAC.1